MSEQSITPDYEGHLDHAGFGEIFGWARNRNAPEQRLRIRIELSNGWRVERLANLSRPDLAENGIGDGRYGFSVKVPFHLSATDRVHVYAEIAGTGFALDKSGNRYQAPKPISHIAGDITNNCNLRCPFCVTDYGLTKRSRFMPLSTFEKCLPLLPLVPPGMFWLSCMHEAMIHPRFDELIELIPLDHRDKISFTTNLCTKQDDRLFEALAHSGFDNIRISLDSLAPDRFASLRRGGKLSRFLENLDVFSQYLREAPKPPRIHVISMAFRHNRHEIEDIVQLCSEKLPRHSHEIRYLFYSPHIADWGGQHLLPEEAWNEMKRSVQQRFPDREIAFFDPLPDTIRSFREKRDFSEYQTPEAVFGGASSVDNYTPADPIERGVPLKDEPLRLRLRWDGFIGHEDRPESDFFFNVEHLDPSRLVEIRSTASKGEDASWTRIQEGD